MSTLWGFFRHFSLLVPALLRSAGNTQIQDLNIVYIANCWIEWIFLKLSFRVERERDLADRTGGFRGLDILHLIFYCQKFKTFLLTLNNHDEETFCKSQKRLCLSYFSNNISKTNKTETFSQFDQISPKNVNQHESQSAQKLFQKIRI